MIKCPFDTLSQLVVNYILSIYTVKLPKRRFAGSNGYSPFSEEVRLYIICAIKYDSLYGYWIKHIVPFFTIPCVEWKEHPTIHLEKWSLYDTLWQKRDEE